MDTTSENVLRRRPIDSGISVGRISNEGDDEDAANDSSSDDLVFKDASHSDEEESKVEEESKTGAIIVFKERLLTTANQLAFGGKYLGIAFLFWFVGYFGFSFLWLAIGVFVFTWREYRTRTKKAITEVLSTIARDEKKYFQTVKDVYKLSGRDLPSWVYFPDVEKAEWLNKVVEQLWPYVCDYVKKIVFEKVEPSIRASNSLLNGFKFSKVDLGEKSPRVAGVKVYGDGQTRRTEVVLDMQIIYQSDANIGVIVNRIGAGIKNLSVRGLMRVELRPLISKIPLAGAVSVAFVHQPSIDFDLTDFGNFFDLPGIDSVLHSAVSDCVHSMMVLPERYVLKLADGIDISKLQFPLPKGVVRVHIVEAKNLEEKDRKILGVGGGSDPFVEVKVGRDHEFRTKTIEHNVNPVWNESFDAPVMDVHTSTIEITLYDDDGALSKADYLGSASVQIAAVYNEGIIDEWIPLSNVKHGTVHVQIEWLELSDDVNRVREAMEHAGKHNLNSALLNIYVDSAKELPLNTCANSGITTALNQGFLEGKYEPSPLLKIEVPGETKAFKTKVAPNTNNPVWEENFRALIQNPRMESLNFKVKSSRSKTLGKILGRVRSIHQRRRTIQDGETKEEVLGTLKVRINQLLKAPNMTKDEPFNLTNSGPKSRLHMRLTARLLLPWGSSRAASDSPRSRKTSAFVVIESDKTYPTKPHVKPDTIEDEAEIAIEALENGIESPTTSESVEDSGIPESSSTNSFGADFANGPSRRSIGRNSSFTSEKSSVSTEESDLRERLDKRPRDETEYPLGRLHLTLTYSTQKEKLCIHIHKAEKLVVCDDENNTSDPYVRVYLLPNRRGSQRRKTKVVKNNVNPVFDEKIEYEVMKGELRERQLDISVKNKTGLLSSEKVLMGQVLVDLASYNFEKPISKWFPLRVRSDN